MDKLSVRKCRHCGRWFQKTHRSEVYCDDQCRFWSKVKVGEDEECWPWTANKKGGYGKFKLGETSVSATRFLWGILHGPLPHSPRMGPPELCVLHSCDNPSCCNPSHLWTGTQADNMNDMVAKGRADNRGMKNGRAKLTEAEVFAIRLDRREYKDIAVDYGVQPSAIGKIKRGYSWNHLPMRN